MSNICFNPLNMYRNLFLVFIPDSVEYFSTLRFVAKFNTKCLVRLFICLCIMFAIVRFSLNMPVHTSKYLNYSNLKSLDVEFIAFVLVVLTYFNSIHSM
jgi:hypothetical protein